MSRAEAIIHDVCREYQVALRDVMGRNAGHPRHRVVAARTEIVKRIRSTTRLSLPQIGRVLGGRHHATIIHYLRKEPSHG